MFLDEKRLFRCLSFDVPVKFFCLNFAYLVDVVNGELLISPGSSATGSFYSYTFYIPTNTKDRRLFHWIILSWFLSWYRARSRSDRGREMF